MPYHQKHPYLFAMWYMIKVKAKELICRHRFIPGTTLCRYDSLTDRVTITETCYKCGKIFTFTTTLHDTEVPERRETNGEQ